MSPSAQALYAQLAKALGVEALPADAQGIVQLNVGDDGRVVLVPVLPRGAGLPVGLTPALPSAG